MEQSLSDKYKEETDDLLAEMEASLLVIEKEPYNKNMLNHILGIMHTIKGTSSMFGFDNIAFFIHEIETVFGCVRDEKLAVTKQLITLSLTACDQIRKMVEAESTDQNNKVHEIIKSLTDLLLLNDSPPSGSNLFESSEDSNGMETPHIFINEKPVTYKIYFRPSKDIFTGGTNPMRLLDELRGLGKCKIIADTNAIPCLNLLNPEDCYLCWDIVLTTANNISIIKDVFMFVEDESEIHIDEMIPDLVLETKDKSIKYDDFSDNQKPDFHEKPGFDKDQSENNIKKSISSNIRVSSEKLDKLMNLVGELITFQAYLSRKSRMLKDAELYFIAEGVERISHELRENTRQIRMLSIGTTFNIFKRLVHDLSEELGKKVVLTTEGEDTELDKTIIEGLKEPLIHIIRNSIDHGIEPPHIRKASGKPEQGTIHLSAKHIGNNVLVKISDDGAGIDLQKVYEKAEENGLFNSDSKISEAEILEKIFIPGISTAKNVTDLSGRGIGMDVVKNCITDLHGTVNISTLKGAGTTVTLKLPLTLAIIDGILIKVGDGNFVIPLSVIEACMELPPVDAARVRKENMLNFRGEIIPYLSLRNFFMTDGKLPQREWIVVVRMNGDIIGVGVDYIIGQHHAVIKSLNKRYKNVKAISGATILGDGTIALILDADQLLKKF